MKINPSTDFCFFQIECDETGQNRYQVSIYCEDVKRDTYRAELDTFTDAYRAAAGLRQELGNMQQRVIPAGSIGATDEVIQRYRGLDSTLEEAMSNPANSWMFVMPMMPPTGPAGLDIEQPVR